VAVAARLYGGRMGGGAESEFATQRHGRRTRPSSEPCYFYASGTRMDGELFNYINLMDVDR
jgi:hypothetical protein